MEALLEAIGVVVVQVFWFTVSTTGLLVQRKGRGRLPPLAERLARAFDMSQGVSSLVGELFWLVIALALLVGVAAVGFTLGRGHEVVASGFALLIDAIWLAYLIFATPRRAPDRRQDWTSPSNEKDE